MLLAALPGCITRSLWSVDSDRLFEHYFVESEVTGHCEVVLESGGVVARRGLWAAEVGDRGRRWWLRPGREAGEVEALLLRADWFAIEAVAMAATRLHAGEDLWTSEVELRLEGRVDFGRVGREMQMGELPVLTQQALQQRSQRSGLAFAFAEQPAGVLDELARRARSLDLAPLLGPGAASPVVAAVELVGPDLLPVQTLAAGDPGLGLAERLQRVASMRLLVEACSPRRRHLFCLQPDLVWLWSCLETAPGGRFSHRSCWTLEPEGAAPDTAPVVSAWQGTMQRDEVTMRLGSLGTWGRVLLTPCAAAADAVLITAYLLLPGEKPPLVLWRRDPAAGRR